MISRFSLLVFFLVSLNIFVFAQPKTNETEVSVLRKTAKMDFHCTKDNGVISEEVFSKMISDERCAYLATALKVDFKTESLLGFSVGGDCHVTARAKVFRDDEQKKYTVKIEKFGGGCRAAGNYQSWFVVEKLKPDYTIEFNQTTGKKLYTEWNEKDVFYLFPATEELQTTGISLNGCIQTYSSEQFAIRSQDEFLKAMRSDASRDWCSKNLEKINFEKNSLLGIGISSDYCNMPGGLEYKVVKDSVNKQYLFNISYLKARSLCRRIGHYDLWLLTPKLEADYPVKFDLKIRPRSDKFEN